MRFYLGVDAGGTKADFALADATGVRARVRTGSIKRLRVDAETAARNLEAGLRGLEEVSGISMREVARTCIGTAGESVPLVREWLEEAFARRVGGELEVVGDVEIALDAAFHGGPGVLVLAGTGSNVAGRDAAGTLTTAGGWGPALGDEGSGHRIGHEGLRAAFRAKDGGEATGLVEAVLKFWGLGSVEALVEYANATPAPDFSQLTEVVVLCAQRGDAVAAGVLEREARDLARLAGIVLRRIRGEGEIPAVAFAGSILEKVREMREGLTRELEREFPGVRIQAEVVDPVAGALWRASGRR